MVAIVREDQANDPTPSESMKAKIRWESDGRNRYDICHSSAYQSGVGATLREECRAALGQKDAACTISKRIRYHSRDRGACMIVDAVFGRALAI